jgi:hypothetical protein
VGGGIGKKTVTDAVLLLLLSTSMGRDDVCGHQLVSLQIQVERNFLNGGSSVIRRKSNIRSPAIPVSAPRNWQATVRAEHPVCYPLEAWIRKQNGKRSENTDWLSELLETLSTAAPHSLETQSQPHVPLTGTHL